MITNKDYFITQEQYTIKLPTGGISGSGAGGDAFVIGGWETIISADYYKVSSDFRFKVSFKSSATILAKDSKKVTMVFTSKSGDVVSSHFNYEGYDVDGKKLIIDVTDYVLGDKQGQSIAIELNNVQGYEFYKNGAYAPYLAFIRDEDNYDRKDISLVDKAAASVFLQKGELKTDVELIDSHSSVHGVGVDLVSSKGGLKLSLEEKFEGSVWTDAYGRDKELKEKYYYKKCSII